MTDGILSSTLRSWPRRAIYGHLLVALEDESATDQQVASGVAAWGFSWRMMVASLACLVHALLPFLFERTGSRAITLLYDRMVTNRQRHAARMQADDGRSGSLAERRAA